VTDSFATYHEEALRQLPNKSSIRPALDLDGSAMGWRAGLAYELPVMALRASIMYYSNLDFSARGTLRQLPLGGNAFLDAVPVRAGAPLPRAVEGRFQTAFAPAWLNTVSVKWVDWSTVTSIPVILTSDSGPLRTGRALATLNAFFRDGVTISDTVTHQLDDKLALSVNLGWDRGVSTGWTENTDTWQTLGFVNYKFDEHLELTGGIGILVLSGGAIDKMAQGGSFNATFGTGNILFTHVGFRYRF